MPRPGTIRKRLATAVLARRTLTATLTATALGAVLYWIAPHFFPLPEDLAATPEAAALFTDREGRPIRRLLADGLRRDEAASFDEFPEVLVQATLAAEDSRFHRHGGVDFLALLRAGRDALLHRRIVSGASTVSQQLVKISSPPRDRKLPAKALEIFTARKLEMTREKEEILAAYLNRLPYGNQFTGARAAARGYFGKPLSDLSLAEATLLAALPNAPSRLNPWQHPEAARERQQWILGRMGEEGWATPAEIAAASAQPLVYRKSRGVEFAAPHFIDLVLEQREMALLHSPDAPVIPDRTTIATTLDLDLQHFVENAIATELAALAGRSRDPNELQAAAVVIENRSGDVLALSGSRSFFRSRDGQVNGAWAPRSAGSTLKPFTYLLALENGFTAATRLDDIPVEYITSTGAYQPVNFDRRFRGPVTLRRALATSLNVPAVRTLETLGGPGPLHALLTGELGFTSLEPDPVAYGLGLTLGNADVRLLELTNAYACLARLGEWRPYRLLRPQGALECGSSLPLSLAEQASDQPASEIALRLSNHPANRQRLGPSSPSRLSQSGDKSPHSKEASPQPDARQLFDPARAWILADILADNDARAEAFGRNSPLRFPFPVAAKTGTSTDFRDNWTLGFTPDFTVGVWVGRFNNQPLGKLSGAIGAGPVFHRIMTELHREREPSWYPEPEGLERHVIDPLTGRKFPVNADGLIDRSEDAREDIGAPGLPPRARREVFTADTPPPPGRAADYTDEGLVALPRRYTAWWKKGQPPLDDVATLAEAENTNRANASEPASPAFRIISPLDGTVALIDPDLPGGGRRFPLRIAGDGITRVEWSSPTLSVENEEDRSWLLLKPGEHQITATDPVSGQQVSTKLKIESL